MMYRVLRQFFDLTDQHLYRVGDAFPRAGANPSDERIAELAGNNNKVGSPLIAEVKRRKKEK